MIDKNFKKAIEDQNMVSIRAQLIFNIQGDKTLTEFREMLEYTKKTIGNRLYDAHDGKELDFNEKNWTEDYMFRELERLNLNFSKERLDLVKKIVLKYDKKNSFKEELNIKTIKKSEEESKEKKQKKIKKENIGIAIMAIGGVMTVGGLLFWKVPLIILGGGSTALGFIIKNKD